MNKRTPKCSRCKRPNCTLDSRRLCASCAAEADAVVTAYRYAAAVEAVAVTNEDKWSIHAIVNHLCFTRAGNATAAPLIWQAVADRVEMGEPANYANVCSLARTEAVALGLNISIY